MASYTVTWEIELDAESPVEAARIALETQRDRDSLATVFSVVDEEGNMDQFDLTALITWKDDERRNRTSYR